MLCVIVLLWNHIHMALQDNSFAVFHTRRCRFADYDIANFIFDGLKAQVLAKLNKKILNLVFMF